MKINKMFCIDDEFSRKLEGINASDLINKLLHQHFNANEIKDLVFLNKKLMENKQILKQTKQKIKEISTQIEKIEMKEKSFLMSIDKLFSKEQVQWLKKQNSLSYDEAVQYAKQQDLIRKGIGGFKLIKLWEQMKNGAV